jgi:hypothetical protein
MILVSDKGQMDVSSMADCKNNDGLGRIRTGDLCRVKPEVLGGFDVFSVGDTTARKANDPLLIV